jgi:hypothetical protein
MIRFLVQDVRMNKMVRTKNMYIPLNVGQVGHFRTPKIHGNPSDHGSTLDGSRPLNVGQVGNFRKPKIHGNPSDHGGTLDGSQHFVQIFKVVDNVGTRVYFILFTIVNRHLSSGVATEHNSAMGKSVNDIHLCKNLKLGL